MRLFRHVTQITPHPFNYHGEDVRIRRQAFYQQGALNGSRNLGGDIARALIADGELALLCAIADHVLKPIEMHLGKSVHTCLYR